MPASITDLHSCDIDDRKYWFRTPGVYDLPKMRRTLARQGLRRPYPKEFEVAALAGIAALGETVGDPAEGARQRAVMEEWYELLEPIREDDIDEPDFEARAVELARLQQERQDARNRIVAEVVAIENTLARHWPPYAELLADRSYWEEVSRIELVRLLLVRIDEGVLSRDAQGMLPEAVYQSLPRAHCDPLAAFATQLLAPSEDERKN